VSTCTTTTTGVGFLLTGDNGGDANFGTGDNTCTYDFLAIPGGQDQADPFAFYDRYCGGAIGKICSMLDLLIIKINLLIILNGINIIAAKIRPFRMSFGTDGTELDSITGGTAALPDDAAADTDNTGFCFAYQEQA
jgi:hypothetical protein